MTGLGDLRGVFACGVPSPARWKVPDAPAPRRFLLDFYRAYRQGGPGGAGTLGASA